MGTRGAYGFIKNGEMKITYNHYDSYLSELGFNVMRFIAATNNKELNEIFEKIIMVKEEDKPTQEQIDECKKYLNLDVGNQDINDWYCLLRNAQGKLNEYKNGLRYMIDNKEFMGDSLFCEYAYILNLDNNYLEIYEGFNKDTEINNDYTQFRQKDKRYVEVKNFDTVPFDSIRELLKKEV